MFKYSSIAVKVSGSMLGLYCLGLAVAPIAYAGDESTNLSNVSPGAFGSGKDESSLDGGKASDNKGGENYHPKANRFLNIRAAQLQAQLEEDRQAYLSASNQVKKIQSQQLQPQSNSAGQSRAQVSLATTSCANPDLHHASNNGSSKLAAAQKLQAQTAANLSQTQARLRLFLGSVKSKSNLLSVKIRNN
jgi:hypothetical protein